VPIVVPTVLAGVGVMETAITQSVAFGYIRKKKSKFGGKYDLVNTYLNRLYHLYHRSIEDARITVEEMDEFHRLIREYDNELSKLNTTDTGDDMHFSKLEHQAEIQARRQYDSELLAKLKDDKKEEIRKRFLRE
jgi:hypothetical protein